jgi:peptidyl-prolyl cis-trans isomerase SurA
MSVIRRIVAAAMAAPLACSLMLTAPGPALAVSQGIIAVANDSPITELDLEQHIYLLEILDQAPKGGLTKQQALRSMIDDQVKITEAKRLGMMPSDSDITDRIDRAAKGMKLTRKELLAKLQARGISEATFRQFLAAQISFSRIIAAKYREDVKASAAEIDAKTAEIKSNVNAEMAKIMNDPRMKPVTVYTLLEISLPVDGEDMMLMQARAIEAQQIAKRFKGCDSAKAAAKGVFDVRIGKKFEADGAKLPKEMKAILDKAGPGSAVGPMRGKNGMQLIAFCGTRKLTPPKPDFTMPSREQIERLVINDKYDKLEQDYLNTIRDKVYVEYRDPSYAPQ